MGLTDKEAALDAHCTIVCGHKHKQDAICLMECPDYEVFNHLPSAQPEPQPYYDDDDGRYYTGDGERLYTQEDVRAFVCGAVRRALSNHLRRS